jgi:DNA-binding response OmpR family regulator
MQVMLPLQGQSILIVEDNALIAMNLEDILRDAGGNVPWSVAMLKQAVEIARKEPVTSAVLDIMLDGEEVWPVARILADRGIPFVFSSGHFEQDTLPKEWADRRIVTKPARAKEIVAALQSAVGNSKPGG